MSEPRTPRLLPEPRPARLGPEGEPRAPRVMPEPRAARAKPDPTPLRMLVGLAGIASASAFVSAMLPSVAPASTPAPVTLSADVVAAAEPPVIHVLRIVQLKPGETAPPQAAVIVRPTPTPRVTVVTTTTRQSGKP